VVGRPPKTIRKGAKPLRVYTLDDGSQWTVYEILNKLKSKWKNKDISLALARARVQKHTDPDKVFCKPIVTKPRTVPSKTQQEIEREMFNFALRTI